MSGIGVADTATYSCNYGYKLSDPNHDTRICQTTGEWSGTEFTCQCEQQSTVIHYTGARCT